MNESRPQVEAIARQKAERRITAAFDEYLQVKLARLNQMTDMRQAVALLLGGDGEPKFKSRTTRDYMEIILSSADGAMPVSLPVTDQPAAPVQIWVKNSIVGNNLAGAEAVRPDGSGHDAGGGAALICRSRRAQGPAEPAAERCRGQHPRELPDG